MPHSSVQAADEEHVLEARGRAVLSLGHLPGWQQLSSPTLPTGHLAWHHAGRCLGDSSRPLPGTSPGPEVWAPSASQNTGPWTTWEATVLSAPWVKRGINGAFCHCRTSPGASPLHPHPQGVLFPSHRAALLRPPPEDLVCELPFEARVLVGSPRSRAEPDASCWCFTGNVIPGLRESSRCGHLCPVGPWCGSGRPTSRGLYGLCLQGREVGACIHLHRRVQWRLPQALAPPVLGWAWRVQSGWAWASLPQRWGGRAGGERGLGRDRVRGCQVAPAPS